MTLEESMKRLGVVKQDVATRANLTLTARYVLEDAAGGRTATAGELRSVKRAPAFRDALRLWTAARAGGALERLVEAEAACKRTGAATDALCAEALLSIAREAGAGR